MDSYVYGKNSVEFVTVGAEFCAFVERVGSMQRSEFTDKMTKLLPLLYLKASLIEPEEYYVDYPEKFVTEEAYNEIRGGMENLLGIHDAYLEVFVEDMQYSDTPVTAYISEDIADIYQDLKDFLSVYRLGDDDLSRAALTECVESFREYWGQKAVNVMRPLHALCYMPDEDEYDQTHDDDDKNDIETLYREDEEECDCGDGEHGHGDECRCRHGHGR